MDLPESLISPAQAATIPQLFNERVKRSPDAAAYRFFDALNGVWTEISWSGMARQVGRWQEAFIQQGLEPGDRVAIMARNSHLWVLFDQAALSLGLVVVPLFSNDRADNAHHILEQAGAKLLMIGGAPQWDRLQGRLEKLRELKCIVSISPLDRAKSGKKLLDLAGWLPDTAPLTLPLPQPDDLATIIYTSGTTGAPKGVMLTHRNILSNAWSSLQALPAHRGDLFLSFLPLSHSLERTAGYYLPMMAGATVAHARGVQELAKDLQDLRPTCLISVPRIYERVHARMMEGLQSRSALAALLFRLAARIGWQRFEHLQGRAPWRAGLLLWPILKPLVADKLTRALGGRVRVAISGGAPLRPEIARIFIGLGIPVLQGYGLTEASPVISVNRLDDNRPQTIGRPLPGVEVRIGDEDELLARGDNIMLGYWNDEAATRQAIDEEGWLHTGDKARLDDGFLYIIGRIKDIIVLTNGEKVSPADMETAIMEDPLFDQALVLGEGMPYLSAIVVINIGQWEKDGLDQESDRALLEERLLERLGRALHEFPGYAEVRRVTWIREPWTVDNDMLTPILKVKRRKVLEVHAHDIARMYEGHCEPPAADSVPQTG